MSVEVSFFSGQNQRVLWGGATLAGHLAPSRLESTSSAGHPRTIRSAGPGAWIAGALLPSLIKRRLHRVLLLCTFWWSLGACSRKPAAAPGTCRRMQVAGSGDSCRDEQDGSGVQHGVQFTDPRPPRRGLMSQSPCKFSTSSELASGLVLLLPSILCSTLASPWSSNSGPLRSSPIWARALLDGLPAYARSFSCMRPVHAPRASKALSNPGLWWMPAARSSTSILRLTSRQSPVFIGMAIRL
mmetsp:Transcript_27765/g.70828  ORF Transcript_27765/g.70828 Transcript_27765/m.70828 type:complete len:242 (-) Transcript_27765:567-1292(-)